MTEPYGARGNPSDYERLSRETGFVDLDELEAALREQLEWSLDLASARTSAPHDGPDLLAAALALVGRLRQAEADEQQAIDDALTDARRVLEVRNAALRVAASFIHPGPDGQDYIERERLVHEWVGEAHDEVDASAAQLTAAIRRTLVAEAEVVSLREALATAEAALTHLLNALSEELAHEIEQSPKVVAAWDEAAKVVEARPVAAGVADLAVALGADVVIPVADADEALRVYDERTAAIRAAGVAVPEAPRDEIILHPSTGEPIAYNVRLPTCECDDAPRSEHMEGCPVRAVPEATTEPKP